MHASILPMLYTRITSSLSRVMRFPILALFIIAVPPSGMAAPLSIAVSILPQKYFVEQIAGNLADVMVMVRPGASPATYEPRPGQMVHLQSSALYFAIGVPFEKTWLPRIARLNPSLPIIHTEDGIKRLPMGEHLHGGDHTHEGHESKQVHARKTEIPDPHIWLDPNLVRVQALNILNALTHIDPGHADRYKRNYAAFLKRITELDRQVAGILAPIPARDRTFMVFHPSWGYFAAAYHLRQIPIESEGKEPGPRELARIIEHGKASHTRAVFVQQQFSSKSAELIARGMGARVVALDPLAENWDKNLIKAAEAIATALKSDG